MFWRSRLGARVPGTRLCWVRLRTQTSTSAARSMACASSSLSGGSLRQPDGEEWMSTSSLATLFKSKKTIAVACAAPPLDLQLPHAKAMDQNLNPEGASEDKAHDAAAALVRDRSLEERTRTNDGFPALVVSTTSASDD